MNETEIQNNELVSNTGVEEQSPVVETTPDDGFKKLNNEIDIVLVEEIKKTYDRYFINSIVINYERKSITSHIRFPDGESKYLVLCDEYNFSEILSTIVNGQKTEELILSLIR